MLSFSTSSPSFFLFFQILVVLPPSILTSVSCTQKTTQFCLSSFSILSLYCTFSILYTVIWELLFCVFVQTQDQFVCFSSLWLQCQASFFQNLKYLPYDPPIFNVFSSGSHIPVLWLFHRLISEGYWVSLGIKTTEKKLISFNSFYNKNWFLVCNTGILGCGLAR